MEYPRPIREIPVAVFPRNVSRNKIRLRGSQPSFFILITFENLVGLVWEGTSHISPESVHKHRYIDVPIKRGNVFVVIFT